VKKNQIALAAQALRAGIKKWHLAFRTKKSLGIKKWHFPPEKQRKIFTSHWN
jgi:hypothetical protein